MNIPKKIHYCWFGGGKLDTLSQSCMVSWQRFCPGYEIIRWDENNSPLEANAYVRQAYGAGKWAFVSDYVRLWALNQYGGIYLDTDVELLKPLDEFLINEAFMGFESVDKIATCVLGYKSEHGFLTRWLDIYEDKEFVKADGSFDETTNVELVTKLLLELGLQKNNKKQEVTGVCLYPRDYFSPKDLQTGRIKRTERTAAVHHFSASWMSGKQRFNTRLAQFLGPTLTKIIKRGLGR